MPDIPVYNFKRTYKYQPSKYEKNLNKRKPLGYRKHAERGLLGPFKCSKCEYIGISNKDTQAHYFNNH